MQKLLGVVAAVSLLAICPSTATAAYHVSFDFDASWTGDYAPGWENTAYRHGTPPVGKMMQQVLNGRNGTPGMQLIADSTPQDWMWWAAVNPIDVDPVAMQKQYNPWISAWYYDPGWAQGEDLQAVGQMFAVPSWVNPYIPPGEDWTDTQFGARFNQEPPDDNYYYVAAGENSPGWQDTGVDRNNGGWVQLKMQLSSDDGRIHYYLDDGNGLQEVGTSYRDDYVDLGTEIGLYTMFTAPLSEWGTDKPSTIWDDFEFGSDLPEPASLVIWGLLAAGGLCFCIRRRQLNK